jgi:ABC-type glutathione transport system ATPase component
VAVVKDVSFTVHPGKIVALVGESGYGKTTIGNAVLGLVPRMPEHIEGDAVLRHLGWGDEYA